MEALYPFMLQYAQKFIRIFTQFTEKLALLASSDCSFRQFAAECDKIGLRIGTKSQGIVVCGGGERNVPQGRGGVDVLSEGM